MYAQTGRQIYTQTGNGRQPETDAGTDRWTHSNSSNNDRRRITKDIKEELDKTHR